MLVRSVICSFTHVLEKDNKFCYHLLNSEPPLEAFLYDLRDVPTDNRICYHLEEYVFVELERSFELLVVEETTLYSI